MKKTYESTARNTRNTRTSNPGKPVKKKSKNNPGPFDDIGRAAKSVGKSAVKVVKTVNTVTKDPKKLAKVAYEVSGYGDLKRFGQKPTARNAAALGVTIASYAAGPVLKGIKTAKVAQADYALMFANADRKNALAITKATNRRSKVAQARYSSKDPSDIKKLRMIEDAREWKMGVDDVNVNPFYNTKDGPVLRSNYNPWPAKKINNAIYRKNTAENAREARAAYNAAINSKSKAKVGYGAAAAVASAKTAGALKPSNKRNVRTSNPGVKKKTK